MGRDCVSEPAGLFFIPQVIHEHDDPRWKYIDRRNPPPLRPIRPPERSVNFTSSHRVAKQEDRGKEMRMLRTKYPFMLAGFCNIP
jgi:hypothetical protein